MIASANDEFDYRIEERRNLYLRMTSISLESLAKLDETNTEFRNTALYGAAEYAALGNPIWETGIATEEQIKVLVDRFDMSSVLSGDDMNMVHTAFRVAEFVLRDLDLARRAAKRLQTLITNTAAPDEYQLRDLAQVRDWLSQASSE